MFKYHVAFRYNDPRKREFRATFQNDVAAAVTRFNYEETLMREQTIRYQRVIITAITLIAITIAVAVAVYIHMGRQRRRQQEELDMLTASELRHALIDLEEQHIATLNHLCDTYYENHNNESVKSKASRDALSAIEKMAKSDDFTRRLEKHLDDTGHGVMTKLRAELPDIKEADLKLFLYNALGLTIPSICLMLGERREVIYNRRLRLQAKIQESDAPDKELFAKFLI